MKPAWSSIKRTFGDTYLHPRYIAKREIARFVRAEGSRLFGRLRCRLREEAYGPCLPNIEKHRGADMPSTIRGVEHSDVMASALALPFANGTFDSILSTEVLEHTPNPDVGLQEMARRCRRARCASRGAVERAIASRALRLLPVYLLLARATARRNRMGNSHDPAERWNVARDWVSTVDLPLYVTRCDGRLPWIADSSASCQLHCRAGLCSRAVGKQSARRGLAKLSQHHGIRRTRARRGTGTAVGGNGNCSTQTSPPIHDDFLSYYDCIRGRPSQSYYGKPSKSLLFFRKFRLALTPRASILRTRLANGAVVSGYNREGFGPGYWSAFCRWAASMTGLRWRRIPMSSSPRSAT